MGGSNRSSGKIDDTRPEYFKAEDRTIHRLGWKIYFFPIALFYLVGYWNIFTADPVGETFFLDAVGVPFYLTSLLGVFLYAFRLRFISRMFWAGFFIVFVIFDLLDFVFTDVLFCSEVGEYVTVFALMVPFMIIHFIPLYCLGFRNGDVWAPAGGQEL